MKFDSGWPQCQELRYGKSAGKPNSDASDLASLEEVAVLSELQYSCKALRLWLEMAENTASIPDRRHY